VTNERVLRLARIFLRLALGMTFLVSVADRFGFLGPYGSKNVSWGDWKHFVQYVATLNWFLPKALIPALSVVETAIETVLGVALLLGIYQRIVAWCSAALLLSFALTMSVSLGIIAPVSYSVFTAFAAAFLLGAVARLRTDRGLSAVGSGVQEESLRPDRSVAEAVRPRLYPAPPGVDSI
jgi:putative oxidoreductase